MGKRTNLVLVVALVLSVVGIYGLVQLYSSESAPVRVAAAPPAAAPPAGVRLATASTPLGTVVTEDGFTLYRFDEDTPKPPTSNCDGKCATTWPPVLSEDGAVPAVDGVDPALVGTVTRSDLSSQVTVKGWPLYRFSGDAAPGETKGDGVGGTWQAIGVDGKPAEPAGPVLATASTPLGTVVTEDGFTLYRFDKDTPKPPTSNCNGKCATTWPPVLVAVGATPAIEGVDPGSVATLTRPDGTEQVTVKGWALYRFTGDNAPGDTNGEGVGGTWHAIGTDGKPAAAPAPAAPAPVAPAPADSGGY
ncbi:MAG: hypothetical protein ACRDRK_13620 [Pseudonocardia sp.]